MLRLLLVLLAAGSLSCAGESAQLLIDLRTDLRSGTDFVDIRTRVYRADTDEEEREVLTPAPATRDLSTGFRIAEVQGLSPGQKRVAVALLDAEGALVAERVTRVELLGTQALVASVTRTCSGVICPRTSDAPEETQCLGGRCVTPECASGVAAACGEPSLSLAELLRRSVDATCEMVRVCTGPIADAIFKGDTCENTVARRYDEYVRGPVLQSLGEGRVIYHGERAFGCLNALRADCRGHALTKQHLECAEAIEGTIPLGGACTTDFDCAGVGSFCDLTGGCPGACTPRREVGEPCRASDNCQPGSLCSADVCAAITEHGAPCDVAQDTCRFDALCSDLGGPTPVCAPISELFVASLGEPCGGLAGVLCGEGLSCSGSPGMETCIARVASDSSCMPAVPDACPVEQYCGTTRLVCLPLPGAGEPCELVDGTARCAQGLACDPLTDGCVELRMAGQSCTSHAQCTLRACVLGVCASGCAF